MSRFREPPARVLPGGLRVYTASTLRARTLGLAWMARLDGAAALHFPRCRSVHTVGMRAALDLIWLDAAGAVVRIDRAVPPRRLRTCRRARSVVEVAAGRAGAFLAAGI